MGWGESGGPRSCYSCLNFLFSFSSFLFLPYVFSLSLDLSNFSVSVFFHMLSPSLLFLSFLLPHFLSLIFCLLDLFISLSLSNFINFSFSFNLSFLSHFIFYTISLLSFLILLSFFFSSLSLPLLCLFYILSSRNSSSMILYSNTRSIRTTHSRKLPHVFIFIFLSF